MDELYSQGFSLVLETVSPIKAMRYAQMGASRGIEVAIGTDEINGDADALKYYIFYKPRKVVKT